MTSNLINDIRTGRQYWFWPHFVSNSGKCWNKFWGDYQGSRRKPKIWIYCAPKFKKWINALDIMNSVHIYFNFQDNHGNRNTKKEIQNIKWINYKQMLHLQRCKWDPCNGICAYNNYFNYQKKACRPAHLVSLKPHVMLFRYQTSENMPKQAIINGRKMRKRWQAGGEQNASLELWKSMRELVVLFLFIWYD